MLGFLAYLPTLAYVPHYAYLLSLIYIIYKYRQEFLEWFRNILFSRRIKISTNILLIICIIILSIFNRIINYDKVGEVKEIFPFVILILLSYLIAIKFSKRDGIVLVYLVCFECFVGMAEYIFNVNTFFTGLPNYVQIEENELFYYKRVLGLSESSSSLGLKILLGYLIIDYFHLKKRLFLFVKIIFFVGISISFNRTVITTLVIYWFIKYLPLIRTYKFNPKKLNFLFITGFVSILISSYFVYENFNYFVMQFTRNKASIEFSGREIIWGMYCDFINEYFFFGNGSFKYYVQYYSGMVHAHNSFLQLLATNGAIISVLYIILIFRNITLNNLIYVGVIILCSLSQYGIFWGISLMDITLFIFLFNKKELSKINKQK